MVASGALRACIYCRISDDSRGGAGIGVAGQEADCRTLATRLGASVVEVFVDNDVSAYTGKPRPEYERLLARLGTGAFDVVLAWHPDRLHRSPLELEEWIKRADAADVPVHTVQAGLYDLSTPTGRMNARLVGVVARFESEHKGERVAAAMRHKRERGESTGGARAFGYVSHDVVHDGEAELVRWAYRQFLAGASMGSIVKAFNDAGVTTARGVRWTSRTLRWVLLRPRNAGLNSYKGVITGPAPWPPLVDLETFEAAASILRARTRPAQIRKGLLSGIVRCGVDGCDGAGNLTTLGPPNRLVVYRCRNNPAHFGRKRTLVDDYVTGWVLRLLDDPAALASFTTPSPAGHADELLALRERRASIASLIAQGLLPVAEAEQQARRLASRIAELEASRLDPGVAQVLRQVQDAGDVVSGWAALDDDQRRALISGLVEVRIHKVGAGGRHGTSGIEITRR